MSITVAQLSALLALVWYFDSCSATNFELSRGDLPHSVGIAWLRIPRRADQSRRARNNARDCVRSESSADRVQPIVIITGLLSSSTRALVKMRQPLTTLTHTIRLIGRDVIEGHDTIVATLTPKPAAVPQTPDSKMMRHFAVRAWINEADAEFVRVDVNALEDLSFGWGVFARVHKGAHATYERRKNR